MTARRFARPQILKIAIAITKQLCAIGSPNLTAVVAVAAYSQ